MSSDNTVDVFWSFRSPYSYLATPRLRAASQDWGVRVRPRPVYPIAIRTPEFFKNAHEQWVPYLLGDVGRLAEFLDLPFSWPNPDPVVQDLETRAIAKEQPYIHRLTRLGILACEASDELGWAYLDEVSRLIWSGTKWDGGSVLADTVAKAGLDLAGLDQRQEQEADRIADVIAVNQQVQAKYHWGVPLMTFREEPFFGQDRIDVLKWRVDQVLAEASN